MPADMHDRLLALSRDATVSSAILHVLTRHFGQNVPTEMIVAACYGSREPPLTIANTIRVRISQLRHVVAPLGLIIVNARWPSSYRLDHAPEDH